MDRRRFLRSSGVIAGAGALTLTGARAFAESTDPTPVPDVIRHVADGDHPDGFTVPAGEIWQIDGLVTTPRNVVVYGELRVVAGATLRFRDVDESAFVGGHASEPLASDVGLWVVDHGVLDAHGTPKVPWIRVDRDLPAGETVLPVSPDGWQVGDEVVVTPTLDGEQWDAHDRVRITGVSASEVTVEPLTRDHPVFAHPAISQDVGAYVVNLTRDCKIEGTEAGKSHVMFLHTHHEQKCSHVELSHLAPLQSDGEQIAGRYATHFHLCFNGSHGSKMVGMSAHDLGGHAFVSHLSNGIDWVACTAHDSFKALFWWDTRGTGGGGPGDDHPPSNDVRYIQCLGSYMRSWSGTGRSWRSPMFMLLEGENDACIGCVAAGGFGTGFHWPEGSQGVWDFRDCVAISCRDSGISGWQNSRRRHVLERFLVARCGGDGAIQHGAYSNRYLYRDGLIAENTGSPLVQHATNRSETFEHEFRNIVFDAQGPYAVEGVKHNSNREPVYYNDCTFTGYTDHAFSHLGFSEAAMTSVIDRYLADDESLSIISPENEALGSKHTFLSPGAGADLSGLYFPTSAADPVYDGEINRPPPDGPIVRSYELEADDGTDSDMLVCYRHPHDGGGLVRVQPGDTLLAFYMSRADQLPPEGFELVADASVETGRKMFVYAKTATDSEPDEYHWRQTSTTGRHGVVMLCVSGSISHSAGQIQTESGTLFTTPTVDTAGLAVCFFARPGIGEIDVDQAEPDHLKLLARHVSSVSGRPAFMCGILHDAEGVRSFNARAMSMEATNRCSSVVIVR